MKFETVTTHKFELTSEEILIIRNIFTQYEAAYNTDFGVDKIIDSFLIQTAGVS